MVSGRDEYFLADLRDAPVQRLAFLDAWRDRAPAGSVLAIDELPSVLQRLASELREKASQLPFTRGRKIHHALWLKETPASSLEGISVV